MRAWYYSDTWGSNATIKQVKEDILQEQGLH